MVLAALEGLASEIVAEQRIQSDFWHPQVARRLDFSTGLDVQWFMVCPQLGVISQPTSGGEEGREGRAPTSQSLSRVAPG